MRVLFFMGFHEYPEGPAATKRAQMLGRGLLAAGVDVRFLSRPKPGQAGSGQGWLTDMYGMPYQLASYRAEGVAAKLVMLARLPGDYRRALDQILNEMSFDAVVCFTHSGILIRQLLSACRRRGIVCVQDLNEWFTATPRSAANPFIWDAIINRRRWLPRLDGIVAISRLLKAHADSIGTPAILVPSLAEPGIPLQPPHAPQRPLGDSFTITYLGPMSARDMPMTMVEGVRLAVGQGHDVRLVVVGDVDSEPAGRRARAFVMADTELKGRVTFTGYVSSDELKLRLAGSDAFMLIRPDTLEARACFPTRLQEYLETARPVVVSNVGDMELYFRHRQDAWLVPPGHSPEAVAEAIIHLKTHPAEGQAMGLAGRETSVREFSLLKHGQRFRSFLEGLRPPPPLG